MDIKTLILFGGGIMIAAVIVHGLWIAWRARREPLRLDIVPDLIPEGFDEDARFKGELPNGGSRVKRDPEQGSLDLDEPAPIMLDTTGQAPVVPEPTVDEELFGEEHQIAEAIPEPELDAAPARDTTTTTQRPAVRQESNTIERAATRARVREVRLEPAVSGRRARSRTQSAGSETGTSETAASNLEELLVIYVLAQPDRPFAGRELVSTLRGKGLRYGQMNIFHRLDPMSKVMKYSVANAVEPGTFDLTELDDLETPGLTFFMRLPGPQQPQEAFDDMWRVARDVAISLGGELKDDQRSAITAQTIEHYRERILEFSRRTLSRRA